jgi:hypothetical protein
LNLSTAQGLFLFYTMNTFANRYNHKEWAVLLPKAGGPDIDQENLSLFFTAMFERQEVYFKRTIQNKPAPWTDDPYLRDYKFTNVYRELDRSSRWLIENVIVNLPDDPYEQLWQIMCYRLFNNPDTFTRTGISIPSYYTYDAAVFSDQIHDYRMQGNNPFTNAYLINAMNSGGAPRHRLYCDRNLPAIHAAIPSLLTTLRLAEAKGDPDYFIKAICKLPNIAMFIAHEFYQDFCYIPRYNASGKPLMQFTQDDYTNVGPGAGTGIRMIFPNCRNVAEQRSKIYVLRDMAKVELRKLGHFKYVYWSREKQRHIYKPLHNITLHQIEMFLCEFQKYMKMRWGVGKQRSKFEARTPTPQA